MLFRSTHPLVLPRLTPHSLPLSTLYPPPGPTPSNPSLSPLSPAPQDSDIQKKIDHEIRMRDGACKLLAACSQRDQALEAAKSLQTCSARIMALMSELQRMKEAQVMQRVARRSEGGLRWGTWRRGAEEGESVCFRFFDVLLSVFRCFQDRKSVV